MGVGMENGPQGAAKTSQIEACAAFTRFGARDMFGRAQATTIYEDCAILHRLR
jgi:hypothetical protein